MTTFWLPLKIFQCSNPKPNVFLRIYNFFKGKARCVYLLYIHSEEHFKGCPCWKTTGLRNEEELEISKESIFYASNETAFCLKVISLWEEIDRV